MDNQKENILQDTIEKEEGREKKSRRRGRKRRIAAQILVGLLLVVLFSFSALGGAVAALGAVYFREGKTETAAEHRPEYLRPSQAERERAEKEARLKKEQECQKTEQEPEQKAEQGQKTGEAHG